MTTLHMDRLTIQSADVGAPNPLPPIEPDPDLDKRADLTAATDEMRANADYGRVSTISPYLLQDGYSRERRPADHTVAVLENEHLRATFLPGLGGRLWSLIDLETGRELLFANPVFQPANFAVRGAWLAGGVEWNIGTIGHTPLTCEPLHAARVTGYDGLPVLRMWAFERLRRVVYALDMHLPPGSRALFAHVRIINANDFEVPLYWWSNIAVPQSADTRIIAPADEAWCCLYDEVLRRESVAGDGAVGDFSYPARFSDAGDFFFDVGATEQPWIAAVDGDGAGVFQTSTRELRGRKLFRWGTGSGGRRWQEWLSGQPPAATTGDAAVRAAETARTGLHARDLAHGYAEMQAGLARTQFEHVPMPARSTWSWTEGYGALQLDAEAAHGPWSRAKGAAQDAVISVVGVEKLAAMHSAAAVVATREPAEMLHDGPGWGAFEDRLREVSGEPPVGSLATPFDQRTLGSQQRPWMELLDTGRYPDPAPGGFPPSMHLHPVLTDALASSPGWAAPALLGVIRATEGDWAAAVECWHESLRRTDNAYARRNLAVAARHEGKVIGKDYGLALALSGHPALWIEAITAFVAVGEAARALALVDDAPADVRSRGRMKALEARAALGCGDLDRCGAILTDRSLEVADLREADHLLSDLWWDYRAARRAHERDAEPISALRAEVRATEPLPAHLDFRMKHEA